MASTVSRHKSGGAPGGTPAPKTPGPAPPARRKTQPHRIVSTRQIVQQHRNIAGAAKLRNFVRTCHHDAGRKLWSIGRCKCAA